jgi:TRAP-type C4-dicarboxylate transport system permease small subunit
VRLAVAITRLTERACAALLIVMVAVMLLQVFCRYVLNASLSWSEELTRLLFVWLTFLGFGLAAQRDAFPTIAILADHLAGPAAAIVRGVRDALSLAVALQMGFYGFERAHEIAAMPTPALGISTGWFPLAVGAGGILLAFPLAGKARERTRSPASLRTASTRFCCSQSRSSC